MAVTSAISDFAKSIGELFASFFNTLFGLVRAIANGIIGFVSGFVELIVNTIGSVFNIAGETVKFFLGNAVLFLIVGLGIFVFLRYQRSQGQTVQIGNKKLN